jgi:DNA modification methylase
MKNSLAISTAGKASTLSAIHPFPARMAPSIVWRELPACGEPIQVLDPMSGSGMALVTARMRGHKAIGFDTDPLAVLITRAWCADVDETSVKAKAEEILERARNWCGRVRLRDAYPTDSDEETREFIRFWFDETNRKQLTALSRSISRVHDCGVRELLWCAFSRLIITKHAGASLAMDVSHSRPHRVYEKAPIKPFDRFMRSVAFVLQASPFKGGTEAVRARVGLGDARRLPLQDLSVDLVITSPPYLNAIDYLRGHKLSLVWMGYSIKQLREIRSTSVGTESSHSAICEQARVDEALKRMGGIEELPDRFRRMLVQYILDMDRVLSELHRVLRPDGRAILVVGDSSLRGVYVQNSKAIAYLGDRNGFKLQSVRRRKLPENRRYLPPPNRWISGSQLRARMREEVVIKFSKKPN